jgi:hypothetical protein
MTKKLGLKIVSYIPMIGDAISDSLSTINDLFVSRKIAERSANITNLASSQTEFDDLFQEGLAEEVVKAKSFIVDSKEDMLKAQKAWDVQIRNFLGRVGIDLKQTVYNMRFQAPVQMLGNKHATALLSKYIANGKIFEGNGLLLPEQRRIKVREMYNQIIQDDINFVAAQINIEFNPPPTNEKGSSCCNIF